MSSSRGRRAWLSGAWAFALTLLMLSIWGFMQAWQSLSAAQRHQTATLEYLSQLEDAQLRMERALLGLAHSDSAKVRFVGYDAARLHSELKDAHGRAENAVQRLLEQNADESAPALQLSLMRLELEWAQTRAMLAEYVESAQPERFSLSTLRAFSFRGQDTLNDALRDFRAEYLRFKASTLEGEIRALAGYGAAGGLSLIAMLVLTWLQWVLPARWIRRAIELPSHAAAYERRLRNTEWAQLYHTLRFQAQRLRAVETFMRDVAMGRTPQRLEPTDSADPLARSSEWLLKRIEQLQSGQRKAV